MRALAILLLFASSLADDVRAHNRSESYSHWHLAETTVTGTVTIPLREVMLLYQLLERPDTPPRKLFHDHLVDNVAVSADDTPCALANSNVLQAASGFVRVEVSFDCGTAEPEILEFSAMYEAAQSHVHYAKLHRDGLQLGESLFTNATTRWDFANVAVSANYSFEAFLKIGVEHIAGGIDHIAFLVGLLLIAGNIGRSIVAVTGFTLGHSISLAAAVLGYVHADSQLVEAFIGFTVALVAVEYFLLGRTDTARFALMSLTVAWLTGLAAILLDFLPGRAGYAYLGFGVFAACYLLAMSAPLMKEGSRATWLLFIATCCFGLVHGFGFAGFLMETGLLGSSLFIPLLGFNLGVELGQLIIVAIALGSGTLLHRHISHVLPQIVAAGLCGIGVFWFLSRTLT